MQTESSLSRQAIESGGGESDPATLTQGDSSTSASEEADRAQDEQVSVLLPHYITHSLPAASSPTEQSTPVFLYVFSFNL